MLITLDMMGIIMIIVITMIIDIRVKITQSVNLGSMIMGVIVLLGMIIIGVEVSCCMESNLV